MLRTTLILCTLLALGATSLGFRTAATVHVEQDAPTARFSAIDIVVTLPDGAELGSYQLEMVPRAETKIRVRVVGIEGGEHPAFKAPPFYDPQAIGNERVILAAYSTEADLPTGTTRIARVHYEITGQGELPPLDQLITLREALTTDRLGDAIEAQPTLTPSKGARP